MTVALDTSVLLYLLNELTLAPIDETTGSPVTHCKERVNYLIEMLSKTGETVVVPTPVLSEILVRAAAAGPAYLQIIDKVKVIRIADFNKRAAVEAAAMTAQIRSAEGLPSGGDARAKLKFDTMIAAIAKINGASVVYSDDAHVKKLGKKFGFEVIGVVDLPLPPENPQGTLDI